MAKNELDLQMEDYQYLPLRDVVFRTLRQAILRGELKPGERLMEIRLANQLGVSRTPSREAIRMLELDGLVILDFKSDRLRHGAERERAEYYRGQLDAYSRALSRIFGLPVAGRIAYFFATDTAVSL